MFTLANVSQMPSYLSKSDFDDWFEKFNQSLMKIGLSKWDFRKFNISIVFSDKIEKKRYGSLTIKELKEIICNIWGNHKEIEKVLAKIASYDDYRNLLQELIGAIHRVYPDGACHSSEELYTFLNDLEFEIDILGKYFNSEKTIILYSVNIEAAASKHNTKNTLYQEFEKVFIHELFHAYHYKNKPTELVERLDYTSKVVKESLASAFEWFYCKENKINGDNDLRESWYNYPVLNYPYFGARELIEINGSAKSQYYLKSNKFFDVFDLSLTDMDGALRNLLHPNVFYKIKNAVEEQEKRAIVTPKACATYASFYKAMAGKKVGEIAKEEIPAIVIKKPFLVNNLLDANYCKKNFNVSIAILSKSQEFFPCGTKKYYSGFRVTVNRDMYYLYGQWYKRHSKALLEWIWANR